MAARKKHRKPVPGRPRLVRATQACYLNNRYYNEGDEFMYPFPCSPGGPIVEVDPRRKPVSKSADDEPDEFDPEDENDELEFDDDEEEHARGVSLSANPTRGDPPEWTTEGHRARAAKKKAASKKAAPRRKKRAAKTS